MLAVLAQAESAFDRELMLDVSWLTPLVALFIPILVGLLAKSTASSQVKAILNMGLSALAGYITTVIAAGGQTTLREAVNGILIAWIASWAAYNGFLKPVGVTDKVQEATAGFGFGSHNYGVEFSEHAESHHVDPVLLNLYEELEEQGTTPEEFAQEMASERSQAEQPKYPLH